MKAHYTFIPLLLLFYGYGYTQSKKVSYKAYPYFKVEPIKENHEINFPKDFKIKNLKEYPPKEKKQVNQCKLFMENEVNIPKVNAIIKEEDYYEKDK